MALNKTSLKWMASNEVLTLCAYCFYDHNNVTTEQCPQIGKENNPHYRRIEKPINTGHQFIVTKCNKFIKVRDEEQNEFN